MIYRFSDLFQWTSGKGMDRVEGNFPLYGSNGIIGSSDSAPYNNKIILGRVGAYCGSVEYEPNDFDATDNTLITTCDTDKIDYLYASYLLKEYNLNSFAGGAAQPVITQGILKHLKCDIPNLGTQKRIADILYSYDILIELNNKRIKLLEQTAQEIYKEWFVRFRFPGYEKAEFEDGMPKKWSIVPLGDNTVSEIMSSGIFEFEGNKEFIATANVVDTYIVENGEEITYENRPSRANMGPEISTVWFAKMKESRKLLLIDNYHKHLLNDIILSTGFTGLKIKENWLYYYFCYLCSELFDTTKNMYANGSTQEALNNDRINKIKLLLPEESIAKRFAELVKPIFIEINNLREKNINLISQRDYLLPRLMSGKLEV